jgi:hypothetical protein
MKDENEELSNSNNNSFANPLKSSNIVSAEEEKSPTLENRTDASPSQDIKLKKK